MTGSTTSTGTNSAFTSDLDTPFLDDRALIKGLKWRFKKIKGYGGWEDDRNDYVDFVDRLLARDGWCRKRYRTSRTEAQPASYSIHSTLLVQDGNFPATWRILVRIRIFNADARIQSLKELFSYDPEEGILRWRKPPNNNRKSLIAGYRKQDNQKAMAYWVS